MTTLPHSILHLIGIVFKTYMQHTLSSGGRPFQSVQCTTCRVNTTQKVKGGLYMYMYTYKLSIVCNPSKFYDVLFLLCFCRHPWKVFLQERCTRWWIQGGSNIPTLGVIPIVYVHGIPLRNGHCIVLRMLHTFPRLIKCKYVNNITKQL